MTDRQDTSYLISDDLASSETQSEQLLDETLYNDKFKSDETLIQNHPFCRDTKAKVETLEECLKISHHLSSELDKLKR